MKKKKGKGKGGAKGQSSGVKKSECPSFGTGHSPDTADCQACATTFPDEFAQCKALTAKKVGGAAPEAKPASPKKKAKGSKTSGAKKEPVPEATVKAALALAAEAIKKAGGLALSGAEMDKIAAKVKYPGGRGPLRLVLREHGLHPKKGARRTKGTKVDGKAVAKYFKG